MTLGVLAALLAVLAVLQNRWLGDLGRADAERQKAQIERAASRFQWAFDREMGQALFAFRPDPGNVRDPRTELGPRLAELRRRDADSIVAGLLLVSRTPAGVALERCDDGAAGFRAVEWLSSLEPLRERLQTGDAAREAFRPWMLHEPPGLAFPILTPTHTPPPATAPEPGFPRWGGLSLTGYVVVLLDVEEIRSRLLPSLAETYFGPLAESELVVAVTRRADGQVLYSSDPAVAAKDLGRGDARRPLPGFDGRGGGERRGLTDRGPSDFGSGRRGPGDRGMFGGDPGGPRGPDAPERAAEPRSEADGPPASGGGPGADAQGADRASLWVLVVRHRGGSLEQAVAASAAATSPSASASSRCSAPPASCSPRARSARARSRASSSSSWRA